MKKVLALLLIIPLLFIACGNSQVSNETVSESPASEDKSNIQSPSRPEVYDVASLSDAELASYMGYAVYDSLVDQVDNEFCIDNIQTVYLSKEYLMELDYNSKENIYFGYNLSDIEASFAGEPYVFTLGDDGKTTVVPLGEYDDTFNEVVKNVAIGSGVILVCVTVSVATGGAAPAVSVIMAASAKTGAIMAASSGVISGGIAGIITGIQTGDVNQALKTAVLEGSEGFKWGAISGAVLGGAGEAIALHGATANGLTMNQVATIQKESKYPIDVIKGFKNMDQYQVCKEANLVPKMVNGKTALVRDIDLNFTDELGRTNLQRMKEGLAALDPATGQSYELHHIGQEVDSTLAILTKAEHMQNGNNLIWHEVNQATKVHGPGNTWVLQKEAFWKQLATMFA